MSSPLSSSSSSARQDHHKLSRVVLQFMLLFVFLIMTTTTTFVHGKPNNNIFQKIGHRLPWRRTHRVEPVVVVNNNNKKNMDKDEFPDSTKYGTAFLHVIFTVGVIATLYLFPDQATVEQRLLQEEEEQGELKSTAQIATK